MEFGKQVHDGFAAAGIEIAGWLVGQNQRLARHARPRRPAAGPGELTGHASRGAPCRPAQRGLALLALGGPQAAVGQRQLHVLEDRQVADKIETLEDEAYLPIADTRPLGRWQLGDRTPVEIVRA